VQVRNISQPDILKWYAPDKGFDPGNTFFISTCLTSIRGSAVEPNIQRMDGIGQRDMGQGTLLTKDLPPTVNSQDKGFNETVSPKSVKGA
jgi:hypothetical protein